MNGLPRVIQPLGWLAGRPVPLTESLDYIAREMLNDRADLLQLADDLEEDELERVQFQQRAEDIRRYAAAIQSLVLQLQPEKFSPQTHGDLLKMARQNSVTLPDWMVG